MKTFEEKWTAWLDGQLTGSDLVEFEASLPDKAAAEAEKREAQKLGTFLKEYASARLTNEDFFNHRIREQIDREDSQPEREPSETVATWWTVRRLIWGGATSLALFAICAVVVMREKQPAEQSQYLTQILNARVDPAANPDATISMFEAKDEKVTVLWTEGLKSLPSEYASK